MAMKPDFRRREPMHSSKLKLFAMILVLLIVTASCGTGKQEMFHIREDVDFSFIKRVAVMPFDNLTGEKSASEIIRHLVISELLASGLVDVVAPGEVNSVIKDMGIKDVSSLGKRDIKSLGKTLRVEAVLVGSVQQYGNVRFGSISAPEVTITLLMADTGSGDIIWSVTKSRGGAGFMARHFGARSETMSETAIAVVRDAIATLDQYNHQ
jgi:TolB-like protein